MTTTSESSGNSLEVALRSVFGFNPQWQRNMEEIQRQQSPDASFPPATQWTARTPILFPLINMILYGMGLTAGIMAWIGFFWALWRIVQVRPDWTTHAIPVFWSGLYFLFMGTRWVKSIRYFLPIYPTLLLLAAWALVTIYQRAAAKDRSNTAHWRTLASGLVLVVVIPTILWADTFVQIYQRPETRVAASAWIYENIPSGATLLYEVDDQQKELHLPLKWYDFQAGGPPLHLGFEMPEDGLVTAVRLNYLTVPPEAGTGGEASVTFMAGYNLDEGPLTDVSLDSTEQAVILDLPDQFISAGERQQVVIQMTSPGFVQADTSRLMNEEWDEIIPVSLDGRAAYSSYYTEVQNGQRPVRIPDTTEKRQQLVDWLEEADYIILSSQRAVWSMPRIPLTYPLMIAYYEALFNGKLGFELVHQEYADLYIGPLYISDITGQISWGEPPSAGWPPPGTLAAEEAFSVYDHPPVWIFQKTDEYNRETVVQILDSVDLTQPIFQTPGQATKTPNALFLSDEALVKQQANGTYRELFRVDCILNQDLWLAAIVWWLMVVLLGWLTFPLTAVILRGLPSRGYVFSRVFAILIVSWSSWLAASLKLAPNSAKTLLLAVLLVGCVSLLVFWRRRMEITYFVRENSWFILMADLLAVTLYILFIGIRLGNSDLWGGETPMALTYLTAVLKSTVFPPYDPWFAGGYINYYYYGFVFVGVLAKLLGIMPAIAYNLILPMLFSFTGIGTFSIAYDLVRHREMGDWFLSISKDSGNRIANSLPNLSKNGVVAGLLAMLLAVILGSLAQVRDISNVWYRAGNSTYEEALPATDIAIQAVAGGISLIRENVAPIYAGDWFWTATHAINADPGEVAPITEFPFLTFLHGDLHTHTVSLPLMLLALAWAVSLSFQPTIHAVLADSLKQTTWWETSLQWLVGGVLFGVFQATNIWDFPTYLVIAALAIFFYMWQRHDRRFTLPMCGQAGLLILTLWVISYLAFWPFSNNFGVSSSSVALWNGSNTYVNHYLMVYGLFLFFIVTYLLIEFRDWTRSWTLAGMEAKEGIALPLLLTLLVFVGTLFVLWRLQYWVAPLILILTLTAGLLGLRYNIPPSRRLVLVMIASALGLTLLVEFFVVEGDIGRANTVFKVYMQVWLLLSVAAGVTAVWSWPIVKRKRTRRVAWSTVLAILLIVAALYPILATRAKWATRMSQTSPTTLDGMAFMSYASYNDANGSSVPLWFDYEAIQWIQREISGSPVIAEGYSDNYYHSVSNRIAMYTGLPNIIGGSVHQRQQRAALPGYLIDKRINDIHLLYSTSSVQETRNIIEKYGVGYIYVGQLERVLYPFEGLVKFSQMVNMGLLEKIYTNERTTIYRVIASSADAQ